MRVRSTISRNTYFTMRIGSLCGDLWRRIVKKTGHSSLNGESCSCHSSRHGALPELYRDAALPC